MILNTRYDKDALRDREGQGGWGTRGQQQIVHINHTRYKSNHAKHKNHTKHTNPTELYTRTIIKGQRPKTGTYTWGPFGAKKSINNSTY